jgi:hypothetical protein
LTETINPGIQICVNYDVDYFLESEVCRCDHCLKDTIRERMVAGGMRISRSSVDGAVTEELALQRRRLEVDHIQLYGGCGYEMRGRGGVSNVENCRFEYTTIYTIN